MASGVGAKRDSSMDESNLIRLHPKDGGISCTFNGQIFEGLSPDVFAALNLRDYSELYMVTRKFNISVAVNPALWPAEAFFCYLTCGVDGQDPFACKALKKTDKCSIHGDQETGLCAHSNLLRLLGVGAHSTGFKVNASTYVFDSIGVATELGYKGVNHRVDNDFDNSTSHFEIKFKRIDRTLPLEYLCLNFHLRPDLEKPFGSKATLERLNVAFQLFFRELGVLPELGKPVTCLRKALEVTPDNFKDKGFSCRHKRSLEVLDNYEEARGRKPSSSGLVLSAFLPSSLAAGADKASEPAPKVTKPAIVMHRTFSAAVKGGAVASTSSMRYSTKPPSALKTDDFPPLGAAVFRQVVVKTDPGNKRAPK